MDRSAQNLEGAFSENGNRTGPRIGRTHRHFGRSVILTPMASEGARPTEWRASPEDLSLSHMRQSSQAWEERGAPFKGRGWPAPGGTAPKRRWRPWNWRTAASRSEASKSGHMRLEKISSA